MDESIGDRAQRDRGRVVRRQVELRPVREPEHHSRLGLIVRGLQHLCSGRRWPVRCCLARRRDLLLSQSSQLDPGPVEHIHVRAVPRRCGISVAAQTDEHDAATASAAAGQRPPHSYARAGWASRESTTE